MKKTKKTTEEMGNTKQQEQEATKDNSQQNEQVQEEQNNHIEEKEQEKIQEESQDPEEEVKDDDLTEEQQNTEEKEDNEEESEQEEQKELSREEQLEAQVKELQEKYVRLSAEFDNYRKRTLKEKSDLIKSAGEDILKGVLPVMDDFDRALETIKDAEDLESVKEGMELIRSKFYEFLKQKGIQEIEAQEKEFDTDLHEAISKIPALKEELKGKVVDVIQKGYYLNDKILRYAKVVVGE